MYYILFDGEHTGKLLIKGGWLDFCSMHQPSMFKGECVVKQKGTLVPQGFTLALANLDGVWQWILGIVVPKPHPAMQKPRPEKRRSLQQSQRRCRSADGGLVLIRCCFNKPLEFESWKRRDELQEDGSVWVLFASKLKLIDSFASRSLRSLATISTPFASLQKVQSLIGTRSSRLETHLLELNRIELSKEALNGALGGIKPWWENAKSCGFVRCFSSNWFLSSPRRTWRNDPQILYEKVYICSRRFRHIQTNRTFRWEDLAKKA